MKVSSSRGSRVALGACLAAISVGAAAAGPWPQPADDAGQTYFNAGEKVLEPNNVARVVRLTSLPLGYVWTTSPTMSGGALYLCSDRYELASLDATTYTLRWYSVVPDGTCPGAILGGDAVYTTAWRIDGGAWIDTLAATNPANGSEKWHKLGPADPKNAPSWTNFNLPTLSQRVLYVSHGRSLVSAYDAKDGHLRWRVKTGSLNNQVAVGDGLVFTTTSGEGQQPNRIYAYRAADGSAAWSQAVGTSTYPATTASGRVFVASAYTTYALDTASGAPLWQANFANYISSPLALTPQSLILVSGHTTIRALDPATGTPQWTTTLDPSDNIESNLVVAGDVLYAATTDYSGWMHLGAFDVRTGQQLLHTRDSFLGSNAELSVMGGKIFVAADSSLLVYGLPDTLVHGSSSSIEAHRAR